jgi:hypothetical protein
LCCKKSWYRIGHGRNSDEEEDDHVSNIRFPFSLTLTHVLSFSLTFFSQIPSLSIYLVFSLNISLSLTQTISLPNPNLSYSFSQTHSLSLRLTFLSTTLSVSKCETGGDKTRRDGRRDEMRRDDIRRDRWRDETGGDETRQEETSRDRRRGVTSTPVVRNTSRRIRSD